MSTHANPHFAGYRYPAEVISTAVWLYFRFPLSLRMVEEMLAAWGITVSYGTVRQWGLKFGRDFANRLRRRAPRRGDKWHLDEIVLTIGGKRQYLWRAVDKDGFVLDVLVQSRRDAKAAKQLLRKLRKRQGVVARVLVTDKLKSYAAAKRETMPGVEHRQHKGLNNRAENFHQPTRRRERQMKRFKSARKSNDFYLSTIRSPTSSTFVETTALSPTTEPPEPKPSKPGPKSPALAWLRDPGMPSCIHFDALCANRPKQVDGAPLIVFGVLGFVGWKMALYFVNWLAGAAAYRISCSNMIKGLPVRAKIVLIVAFLANHFVVFLNLLGLGEMERDILFAAIIALLLSLDITHVPDAQFRGRELNSYMAEFSYSTCALHTPIIFFLCFLFESQIHVLSPLFSGAVLCVASVLAARTLYYVAETHRMAYRVWADSLMRRIGI